MASHIAILRRSLLMAAGVSLATSVIEGATAEAQAQALSTVGSTTPAIADFRGRLYAVWKDANAGLWYASFDGAKWTPQTRIPGVATSAGPSVTVFGTKLYAAWKGRSADQRLWFASFDGLQWSPQEQIPGATSGGGPALSVSNRKLYAMWKSAGDAASFSFAAFDGTGWSGVQNVPSPLQAPNPQNPLTPFNPHPFSPQVIANSGLSGAGGVDQGKYNDCVFEASAAAVATTARGQMAISQAIMQDADGNYTVTFPGEPQRPIRVTPSDLKTTGVHDRATWADVLEAALIVSNPNFANGARLPPNAVGAADGSRPTPAQYALHLLTGNPASKDVASTPKIADKIAKALSNGQPVVAFCANNDGRALASGHEWTVMACDPQADQVTLRNPWGRFGTAGTTKGGVAYDGDAEVTMTVRLFGQFYREVTFGYHKA